MQVQFYIIANFDNYFLSSNLKEVVSSSFWVRPFDLYTTFSNWSLISGGYSKIIGRITFFFRKEVVSLVSF